jgi:Ni,Fe-hydrogenase I cytochrome b subunit
MYALRENELIMSNMRFVHFVGAYVFTVACLIRIYWLFAGNQYAQWRAMVPITKAQWKNIIDQFLFYVFLRKEAPRAIGHTGLAALSYIGIFALFLVEVLTGLPYSQSHRAIWGSSGMAFHLHDAYIRLFTSDHVADLCLQAPTSTWVGMTISGKDCAKSRSSADTKTLVKDRSS